MEQKLKTNLTADEGRVELGRVQAIAIIDWKLESNKQTCLYKQNMNMRRATEKMQGRDAEEEGRRGNRQGGSAKDKKARYMKKRKTFTYTGGDLGGGSRVTTATESTISRGKGCLKVASHLVAQRRQSQSLRCAHYLGRIIEGREWRIREGWKPSGKVER
ncbi:hypothetical protein B0H14DRAFT_2597951 [Mycena olivaceomarginata]|nr:hypothetical protein B0H14DRAFT_2597951 [Mycena olivaceomarginata]